MFILDIDQVNKKKDQGKDQTGKAKIYKARVCLCKNYTVNYVADMPIILPVLKILILFWNLIKSLAKQFF